MPDSEYDDLNDSPDANAGQPSSRFDFGDDPSVFEMMAPYLATTLEILPLPSEVHGAASRLIDALTRTIRQQRHEREAEEAEEAELLAQKKAEKEEEDRAVADRMGRLQVEREEERAKRREEEQEVQEALRRGAEAEALLEAQDSAHWIEKMLVAAARDRAQSLKSAVTLAESLGASGESFESSLRLHIAEQTLATSKFVSEILNSALEIGCVVERKRTKRTKGKSYGPVA